MTEDHLRGRLQKLSKNWSACAHLLRDAPNARFDAYHLNSGREGPGMAALTVLTKPVRLSQPETLFLLWCRDFVFAEEWDRSQGPDLAQVWDYALGGHYMADAFATFVAEAELSSIRPAEGREAIKGILDMMRYEWGTKVGIANHRFQVTKFGEGNAPARLPETLFEGDFLSVTQIKDAWNDRAFFFETPAAFCHFSWGTSA